MLSWLRRKIRGEFPKPVKPVDFPGDRACCLWRESYDRGREARVAGEPCVYVPGPSAIDLKVPISQWIWECGWRGEPMPKDIVEFCLDPDFERRQPHRPF